MKIDIVTILPSMVADALGHSMLGRFQDGGLVTIRAVDLRSFADDTHRTTDDTPCGGGGGMIMKPNPIAACLDNLSAEGSIDRVILTDPQGVAFTQQLAWELSRCQRLVFVCGRYEGVDERVAQTLVTDRVSIGDFVVTGGELPALLMVDAIGRLLPGALGDADAARKDTFAEGLLEHPQYTRPRVFRGRAVPDVLFGGDHAGINRWRRWHQLHRTKHSRPDLWTGFRPSVEDLRLMVEAEPID